MKVSMGQPHQIIQGANEDGTPTGEFFSKEEGHTGKGRHHFAISIFIYNNKGQLLLQKRKHLVFDYIWDMTASTHQLHKEDGSNETDEEAALRSLKREYNIDPDDIKDLRNFGGINYFAQYGEFCENEHDKILTAELVGDFELNPEVGYGIKWMDKYEFLKDIEANPKKYAPWAVAATPLLKRHGFFNP
ncbi:NUDIX domain-containing protein [Candidatus Daviesbacteria bacterium]|nr:NUDIX domain-containing protein [Candidatus Daviesbacteria bacterium]